MRFISILAFVVFCSAATAGEKGDPRIALDSEFPDPGGAKYFSGEITLVEHVNRIGILRLDRDGTLNKYFWDLPHEFRMLPYGAIFYHGAPAELKDIPIGTHLHGKFYLGPEGPFEVDPPESGYVAGNIPHPDLRSVESQYSRVLRLEDDFSFYEKQGAGWKIESIGENLDSLVVERVLLQNGNPDIATGDDVGMTGEQVFRIDRGTRIWKGNGIGALEDLASGQVVQLNLGWVSLLGSDDQDGLCRDVWIDKRSRDVAREQQRQIHIAYQKRRGIPATVIKTESLPNEGAKGYMTVQFHAGTDPSLIDEILKRNSAKIWAVEPTLRGYDDDFKSGSQFEVKEYEVPEPGSSGIEVRMLVYEMLEGFRKGRTVRLASQDWKTELRPREERLWQNDLRIFKVGPKPIVDRDGPPKGKEKK